jgi:hypothetical protein
VTWLPVTLCPHTCPASDLHISFRRKESKCLKECCILQFEETTLLILRENLNKNLFEDNLMFNRIR